LARVGTEQNAVVTYIPRRRRAVAEEGVDQGYELARALGRSLELPVLKTLQNKGKTAQKTLDHAERQAQADTAIRLRKTTTDAVRGKTVVLVDDITTAGATLAAATRQLLDAGAAQVVCCVVGVTANAAGGKEIP
jgi:competence protein ComFC